MVVGVLGAIAQDDLPRILSFSIVSQIGYMIMGLALSTPHGPAAAMYAIVHHIAVQTALFLVAGLVERTGGTSSMNRLGGLAATSPALPALFLFPAMSLAGIPPFSGFLAKVGLLHAGIKPGRRSLGPWSAAAS